MGFAFLFAGRRPAECAASTTDPDALLVLTACTALSAVGRGAAAIATRCAPARAGCGPTTSTGLGGWIGRVPDVEAHALPPAMAGFDCRNNRLADMALRTDGFADAVAEAGTRLRRGPDRRRARHQHRPASCRRRTPTGSATATSGRSAGRVRLRPHPGPVLARALRAHRAGPARPGAGGVHRLRLQRARLHGRGATDPQRRRAMPRWWAARTACAA